MAAQTSLKPLRASQVMALEAGGALQANIAHDVALRGLAFHPDDEFLSLMKRAGADAGVIAALKAAKVDSGAEVKPDAQLLRQLSDASVFMIEKKYAEAGAKLSEALDTSFARVETGFAMAQLMVDQERYDVAVSVYGEILEKEPDFPEVHTKASLVLFKLGDAESALSEAKKALEEDPNNTEAHKNKGLALEALGKADAAIEEYKEALRIKPDYALIHYDLGVLYGNRRQSEEAIAEYKKAIALNPNLGDAHYNLGNTYRDKGNLPAAISEFREAKQLDPDKPAYRNNLASALMNQSPGEAIKELKELEQKFPNFDLCHICLGRALAWQGDIKGAEDEFRKLNAIDPTDPAGHLELGSLQEEHKNLDGALEEFREAERIAPGDAETHKAVGRILLAKERLCGGVRRIEAGRGSLASIMGDSRPVRTGAAGEQPDRSRSRRIQRSDCA